MSSVTFVFTDLEAQRLDNFLFRKIKIPKSHLYRLIRKGEVKINRKKGRAQSKLSVNDQITIYGIAETDLAKEKTTTQLFIPQRQGELLLQNILYEDARLMVLNKPSGFACHGGSGINFGVIELLRQLRPEVEWELVHRLDRETSGCLMLAKKRSCLHELHRLLRSGAVTKRYWLMVKGPVKVNNFKVKLPLSKNLLQSGERMVMVDELAGKSALTVFTTKKVGVQSSLLEAELKTGRTHQIRVHAAQQGWPIAGDKKYGAADFNALAKQHGITRLALHAHEIRLIWEDGTVFQIVAPLREWELF